MQNNIRNTNLRFNLDKEQQRRAWEYLQTMNRQDFKSYSQVISLALVDYFDRYYRTQADPLTGRIILNAYPVIWLLPENNIGTMPLPSSVGQDRIILLPGKGITKVRNTKHYDKIYRKSNRYNTKQRASA